jgi:hypothetical protein
MDTNHFHLFHTVARIKADHVVPVTLVQVRKPHVVLQPIASILLTEEYSHRVMSRNVDE